MNARRQRGPEIAATSSIARKGEGEWLVPSRSLNGKYRVRKGPDGFLCKLPRLRTARTDLQARLHGRICAEGETRPDGTVIETRAARVTYTQNWPAYNRAQSSEKEQFCTLLRDLVAEVPSPEQKRGRPSLPLSDMIFAAAFKVYSTVSARRFITDLRSATALGIIDRTPHYNSIFNVLDRETMTRSAISR